MFRFAGKILLVLISVNCFIIHCTAAGDKSHVVLKSRQYELFWSLSNGTIAFELHVNTKGWIGVGFAPTPSMEGADLVIAGLNDETGQPYIYDRYALANGYPSNDLQQSFELIWARQNDSYTVVKFQRKMITDDRTDYKIEDKPLYLLWAWGSSDAASDKDIVQHSSETRGARKINLLHPLNDDNGKSKPVVTEPVQYALFLVIHLSPNADAKTCAKTVANLQSYIDAAVSPIDQHDSNDDVIAGVGFGAEFYRKIPSRYRHNEKNFTYSNRVGPSGGTFPATNGDIFVHAKSNDLSRLYELAEQIRKHLPADAISRFNDDYAFKYRNGRDLSGFIDGTENPSGESPREHVAINNLAQKWLHDRNLIWHTDDSELESFVGRRMNDSVELRNKCLTSHVARMTSGPTFDATKPFQIVRQSMPWGTVGGNSGLYFCAFSASLDAFEYMLNRMIGLGADGLEDDIMKISKPITGSYFYFPSQAELNQYSEFEINAYAAPPETTGSQNISNGRNLADTSGAAAQRSFVHWLIMAAVIGFLSCLAFEMRIA